MLSARELALKVLYAVDVEGAYGNLALTSIMGKYRPQGPERALLTELCYGTLRRLNTIDWVLAKFIKRPLCEQNPWIRNILRLAVYQILYLDRIPPAAATNEAVELAKKYAPPSMAGFVNAVLRRVVREKDNLTFPDIRTNPVDHLALKYSHPTWLVEMWLKEFGLEETIRICEANNQPAAATLRTNLLRITREELMERLRQEADLRVSPTLYAPEGIRVQGFFDLQHLPSYQEGLFYIQDESSMLAAHALAPASGSFILDVCGAPGGKATHLAELMRDSGRILVVDIYAHRLALVVANVRRLGLKSVETLQADARSLDRQFAGQADYVLADVPCSGLGVLRRKPDIRWRKEPEIFPGLVALQQEILESAAACVRPGGVLLYCTCTLGEAENLGQIKRFLSRHSDFLLEDLRPFLPEALDREGTLRHGYIQIMPYQGMDGFFIARLRRKKLTS
ncbi:16S rRNA (cytosine(967)-C(5))-methyltransferase RsmB [Ammonifex thiophilus]|uniref:16S rRNA (cytosine(967)-C(5))-methyltransferase n=1 Tax=Ammonifex thiophilus TaxID=444093 RepID=A0A3D8P5F6_9THEO|nr:16S rRNA (cytosine(967)-C(5))-methyltransferase RsmB [Ammonifex thiophilus]RDV83453.1 16S rRNA (cytosine(967)-C(5))-methyltransferase RsmB [Ammonifex thiophilus]